MIMRHGDQRSRESRKSGRSARRKPALRPAQLLLVGALLLSGCFGARVDHRRYYSLPAPAAKRAPTNTTASASQTSPAAMPLWPGTIHVDTLAVSPVLDRVGLVMRRSDVELRYSADHDWVQRPQHLVSDRVAAALEASGLFRRVVRDLSENSPDWTLRGRILAFEVLTGPDGGGPWRVHVALQLSLRRVRDGLLLWRRSWSRRASLASPDAALAARAMGRLLDGAIAGVKESCHSASQRTP